MVRCVPHLLAIGHCLNQLTLMFFDPLSKQRVVGLPVLPLILE
jgi:hypothetical protein